MFVPPKKFHFSRKSIAKLKVKAAEFLTMKFGVLYDNPGQAVLLPRVSRQNKETTTKSLWKHGGHQPSFNQWVTLQ